MAMILPPFDPPTFDELTAFWRQCTYADVHRLVLEVIHQRLTLMELTSPVAVARQAVNALDPEKAWVAKSVRKVQWLIDAEITRAGPLGNTRDPIAPFSDEWRARHAVTLRLYDRPVESTAEQLARVGRLPEFERIKWNDLRMAWRKTPPGQGSNFTLGQRLVLESAKARQEFRKIEKLAVKVQSELAEKNVESPALTALLRAISAEIRERGW
ncbi:hypothetical protein DX980_18590 [Burkholderia gladioli]|nr:hypothetical protein DX980_18590 [Burkholderia gladioli]